MQYYEQRLTAQPDLINQKISGPSTHAGEQLVFNPVPHTGNQNRSEEEAQAINSLINELLSNPHHWTDSKNISDKLEAGDVLALDSAANLPTAVCHSPAWPPRVTGSA